MDKTLLYSELTFKATRSSGPGGQHVNKTSTRVELYWDLLNSKVFELDDKLRLQEKLKHRITKEGVFQLASEHTRSQHRNKEDVTQRFFALLEIAIKPTVQRKKRRPSQLAKAKRLQAKRVQSEKKTNRKKPDF